MIRRCLILDLETTGLDPKADKVVEIGAILYDVEHQCSLVHFATLIGAGRKNEAESINRIPQAALEGYMGELQIDDAHHSVSHPWSVVFDSLIYDSDVLVAHNAEFDRSFLGSEWRIKPWVCTRNDFKWPRQTREGESLVSQALNHGIGVSSAHRALTDCLLIAALFDRMVDLQAMFTRAMRPTANYRALVSYEDREKAKTAGFVWDGPTKTWSRRMAIDDAAALPFRTAVIP